MNNAGTIWYEEKKYARAIRAYRKAIGIKPDFAPFYVNLGYAYFNDKKYDDSILSFRKALEIDPSAFDPSRSRSGTVIQDRSVGTDRGRFYFMLAKSFAEAGNLERCIIYLKKSKDEGFADINSVKTDPSFAAVISSRTSGSARAESLSRKLFNPEISSTPGNKGQHARMSLTLLEC